MKIRATVTAIMLGVPAAMSAQYSGVSHPDETPIVSSPEMEAVPRISVPPAAQMAAPAQAELKPRLPLAKDAAPAAEIAVRRAESTAPLTSFDPDANIVTRVPGPSNQLPPGTTFKTRLAQEVSTVDTANRTHFTATLVEPVERDGKVLLPAGSTLSGMVTDVHGGKRISGPSSIHLRTTGVMLPDGTRYAVHAQVIDTGVFKEVKVDNEGTIVGRDHARKTAAVMGLATGSGATTGALLGGLPGALIGAGVGAGVSTVVWLRQDRQTELPLHTKIVFSLTEPLTVE